MQTVRLCFQSNYSERCAVSNRYGTSFCFLKILKKRQVYKDIEWSVSEEGIASIDENGVLTANATGIVIVTAEAKSGVT